MPRIAEENTDSLSLLGRWFEVWKLIVEAVKARAGSTECLKRLLRPEGEQDVGRIADLIVGEKQAFTRPLRHLKLLPVQSESFSADATFLAKKVAMKLAYIGDNFRVWFSGKKEQPAGSSLEYGDLPRTMTDDEIIADLGGEEVAQVTLAQIWQLLERQSKGENGPLLTNGYANIFYVRDAHGVLRTVGVDWRGGGWFVLADVLGSFRWRGGARVFSSQLLPAA